MTQRGRKSSASLVVVPTGAAVPNRPEPPAELGERESVLWRVIVEEKPVGWFDAASLPLLAAYCRTSILSEDLAREFKALGKRCLRDERKGAAKLILDQQDKVEKRIATLATKLRLTQQSRYTAEGAGTAARNAAKPKLWEVPR